MTTISERVVAWLIASMLAVGAWMIFTSCASGAEFRSVVSSAPSRPRDFLATTSQLASDRVPAGSILQAGNSDVSAGIPTKEQGTGSGRLGQQPRLAACNSFLDAIERVESNGNPQAIGDRGKARGPFQFWATAWADCSRARSKQGLSVADYWSATNRAVARSYAQTYLGMLHHQLTRALRRTPTHAELYAAWNMGFTAYRRTGFSLSRCPESTRRAAARINSMLRS